MRWLRLLKPLITSRFQKKITLSETSSLNFYVWFTDIDVTIMNHAAMMSVFESGRIDYMVRTGFLKLAKQKKWYFPIASINVQFFRPLKIFQKALLTTRVFHMAEQFIYMEQKIIRHGKEIALCIVKSKVKAGRDNVLTSEIIHHLSANKITYESEELIEKYEALDSACQNEFIKKMIVPVY